MSLSIGVLVSGSGTNLQAILDAEQRDELGGGRVVVVISNRKGAGALERAQRAGVPTVCVNHKDYPTRELFEDALIEVLEQYKVELVVLAGFMRLLSPHFLKRFPERVVNIHPALLPSFPGLHAQRQAVEYGVRISGCTVHFVDEGIDSGPIIAQVAVPVLPDDTEETLAQRILKEEHRLYPRVIRWFAEGRIRREGRRVRVEGVSFAEGVLRNP